MLSCCDTYSPIVSAKVKFTINHLLDFYFGYEELRPKVKKLILTVIIGLLFCETLASLFELYLSLSLSKTDTIIFLM